MEFNQRRLADWAFMLRDYVLAYQTYKSLADHFKSDQAFRHQAAALEMSSLSLWLAGQVRSPPKIRSSVMPILFIDAFVSPYC